MLLKFLMWLSIIIIEKTYKLGVKQGKQNLQVFLSWLDEVNKLSIK